MNKKTDNVTIEAETFKVTPQVKKCCERVERTIRGLDKAIWKKENVNRDVRVLVEMRRGLEELPKRLVSGE